MKILRKWKIFQLKLFCLLPTVEILQDSSQANYHTKKNPCFKVLIVPKSAVLVVHFQLLGKIIPISACMHSTAGNRL